MAITRTGFSQVVANGFSGLGFTSEAPTVYEFPWEMFIQGSDLSPIRKNIDKVVFGLTKWQPKIKAKGVYATPMVIVKGNNYAEAVNNMEALFLKNMWSDGLPLKPPTKEQVAWILTGTDLPRDTVIGNTVLPRGGIATVESIAVSLAMAGGRPEYLPLLIAAIEAVTDPTFKFQATNSTTCSVVPAFIVDGPIARQIRLGSGYGLLSTDPQHPAGGVLGRALRLISQDLGGGIPGVGSMAVFGGLKSTYPVFAEDEEGLPKGWTSLAEDRGFKRGQNVVTTSPVSSMVNVNMTYLFGTKETNDRSLMFYAKAIGIPNTNAYEADLPDGWTKPNLAGGVALLPRGFIASLVETSGYSKMDIKRFLWENSKVPWAEVLTTAQDKWAIKAGYTAGEAIPLTARPEQMTLVVAGGDQSGHSYWMQVGRGGNTVVSREIKLPKNWDALLKQAQTDLGPIPLVR